MVPAEKKTRATVANNNINGKEYIMVEDLNTFEIEAVNGAGVVDEIVKVAGEVVDAAYDSGHRLGSAIRGLFTDGNG